MQLEYYTSDYNTFTLVFRHISFPPKCEIITENFPVQDVIYTFSAFCVGVGNLLMMTSLNGNIFRVTGPLCGEFTGPGEFPTQKASDAEL